MLSALQAQDRAAVEACLSEPIPDGALEVALDQFPEMAPFLVEHGANVRQRTKRGFSVLIIAIEKSIKTAMLILEQLQFIGDFEINWAIDMERDEFLAKAITTFKAHPMSVIDTSRSKFYSKNFPLSIAATQQRSDFQRLSEFYSPKRSIYTEMLRYGDMYVLEKLIPDENFRRTIFALRNTQINLTSLTPEQQATLSLCL